MNKTLTAKVANGLGWAFGSSVSIRLAQLLSMVVLARLLLPSQFGLFALANIVITALNMIRDYGLAESLLYIKTDIEEYAETTFVLSVAFGLIAAAATFACAPLMVRVVGTSGLIWPLRAMSLSIVLLSTSLVPAALLERELEFRKRALPEIAMGVAQAAVAITLAYLHFGVWSLVLGYLTGISVSVAWTWRLSRWRPAISFTMERAERIMSFGKPLMASSVLLLSFFYLDQAAIGRWVGVTSVGFYSLAFTICHLPVTNITFVVNRVMYPAYTKLNTDLGSLTEAYARAVRSISVVSVPIGFFLFLLAGDVIVGVLGERWRPAIPLVRMLAIYGTVRSIAVTADCVFMAMGKTKLTFRVNAIQMLVALPLVYPAARHFGSVGVAVLFTGAYSIGGLYGLFKITQLLKLPPRRFASFFVFPVLASVTVISASFGITRFLPRGIVAGACAGAISLLLYAVAVLKYDRESLATVRSILRANAKATGIEACSQES